MPDTPPLSPDEPSSANDIGDWIEALAGRPREGAEPAVNAEAALLREAWRRWPVVMPPMTAEARQAQLDALLARARQDPRLAARQGCTLCETVRRWLTPRRLAGALALGGVATLAIVITPLQAPAPGRSSADAPADTLRGLAGEGVQRLRAADARVLRDRIADELAATGIPVTRYERRGRFGLDAELPEPLPDALLHTLRTYGLTAPASGGLAVEVESGL